MSDQEAFVTPPPRADILEAIDSAIPEGEVSPEQRWIGGIYERGENPGEDTGFMAMPITVDLLPATSASMLRILSEEAGKALGCGGPLTFYDYEDVAVERLTRGHFRTTVLPSGRSVEYVQFNLKKPPTL